MGPQEMSGGPVSRKQLGWLQGWGRWVGSAQVIQEGQGVMRPVLPEDVGGAPQVVTPTVVLEKTLESPLDCKEIQPVHPKGNQS